MKTLRLGVQTNDTKHLCTLLGLSESRLVVDQDLHERILAFQGAHGLQQDGICGWKTWTKLYETYRETNSEFPRSIENEDYVWAARLLDCEVAAIRSVVAVETGGRGGFLENLLPPVLFEGHIFWRELKSRGVDPTSLSAKNPTILYPKWTKKYYVGGVGEWQRLLRAESINRDAADSSASWGMFQILGTNYRSCGCTSVAEFVEENMSGEVNQLLLGIKFIHSQTKMLAALQGRQWATFARLYNGPGYAVNKYDTKLRTYYEKFKK